uniref:DNA 3'-5' helicase n=1 Tax=Rhizochromulina marina TaxID=1034831 RepID=A0A7S2SKM4_9STRA|mmetsp:Transcript_30761/g.89355  ORF Transcript_30761/g.89355 Transcript_30761/m.89355 type:complete len:823 (+) Transcript_30761:54-2522(+)
MEVKDETGASKAVLREADLRHAQARLWTAPGNPFEDYPSLSDCSGLIDKLRPDHALRPVWVCPNLSLFFENIVENADRIQEFLVAIAEPVSRPDLIHQYKITAQSLNGAVYGSSLDGRTILRELGHMSKTAPLPDTVVDFVESCTSRYCQAKLVLRSSNYFVESNNPEVLRHLLENPQIQQSRFKVAGATSEFHVTKSVSKQEELGANTALRSVATDLLRAVDKGDDFDEDVKSGSIEKGAQRSLTVSFMIKRGAVEQVKREARNADYPLLEEYDFRNDMQNPSIEKFNLRVVDPRTDKRIRVRPYQEKALSRMFGNGRARSGIIVLPCGAGKTFVGIAAAQTIRRSCLVVCTPNAAEQWKREFQKYTDLPDSSIAVFNSNSKPVNMPNPCILVSTYSMLGYNGPRSVESAAVMQQIQEREWGLMLLDEVHTFPATTHRNMIEVCKAHCRLGLTATLVREDDKIDDLDYLIGPKLFEANWMDLVDQGYLAEVQCVEVWCPMAKDFHREYLRSKYAEAQKLLSVMNASKFRAAEFLVGYHSERGDKILLYADNIWALETYCKTLGIPYLHGETSPDERLFWLGLFRGDPRFLFRNFVRKERKLDYSEVLGGVRSDVAGVMELKDRFTQMSLAERSRYAITVLGLSKIGDVAIDLPDASVLLQVDWHGGGRQQEAQRMGRILRPKPNAQDCKAFFYSLVSRDTKEMYHASKRQQYLIDQGYTYKVLLSTRLTTEDPGSPPMESIVPEGSQAEADLLEATKQEVDRRTDGKGSSGHSKRGMDLKKGGGSSKKQKTSNGGSANSSSATSRHLLFRSREKKKRPVRI